MLMNFDVEQQQIILNTEGAVCTTPRDLLESDAFARVVDLYCRHLERQASPLIDPLLTGRGNGDRERVVVSILKTLARLTLDEAAKLHPELGDVLGAKNRGKMLAFVEGLYNFWRSHDRFMVLRGEPGSTFSDQRPYRAFNSTVENLAHIVRATYRDICENISGDHPRIYRQVAAGCDAALIAVPKNNGLPEPYAAPLAGIPFIRQVWIAPPLMIDPPMNKRSGQFERVDRNPLAGITLNPAKWLCFPVQVGPLVVHVYFHQQFIGLGTSLANLFELATDEQISRKPDAIYVYGAPPEHMAKFGDLPTVFYDDEKNGLLVGAVPGEDRFGYFGYVKKMVLTLHNIAMMKRGRMPYHGAMVRIGLRSGKQANVLIIGDTATGKSESLEAFRIMGTEQIRELSVIADDMGSLEIGDGGKILGYGTETGAFVRLDDLAQGYVFEHTDRAIIMSPQKVNARVVVPVTTLEEVLHGYPVDFLLYANNFEETDEDHPVLERFTDVERALAVFREGAAMAKGTTTSSGLVHSYFANIFGPQQYREMHDKLAVNVFKTAIESGVWVGQMRTRLGIPGRESEGPQAAAKALFDVIAKG